MTHDCWPSIAQVRSTDGEHVCEPEKETGRPKVQDAFLKVDPCKASRFLERLMLQDGAVQAKRPTLYTSRI